jgi:hypothetical protein
MGDGKDDTHRSQASALSLVASAATDVAAERINREFFPRAISQPFSRPEIAATLTCRI